MEEEHELYDFINNQFTNIFDCYPDCYLHYDSKSLVRLKHSFACI